MMIREKLERIGWNKGETGSERDFWSLRKSGVTN